MLEKTVEQYLVMRVRANGGIAYKFSSPARRGVPDRLVLWPGGEAHFVEVKAPGKKPTKLQLREINTLHDLGFMALVIDTKEKVDDYILSAPVPA
jgi:hypothetical protein